MAPDREGPRYLALLKLNLSSLSSRVTEPAVSPSTLRPEKCTSRPVRDLAPVVYMSPHQILSMAASVALWRRKSVPWFLACRTALRLLYSRLIHAPQVPFTIVPPHAQTQLSAKT
jgi:hypothetical protein